MRYTHYDTTYELTFYKSRYIADNSIFIEAWCREDGDDYWEPYADVTKCLYERPADGCSFLDTNNVGHLIQAMVDEGYVELTGRTASSGWCEYPEGRFDKEWLEGLEELA